MDNRHFVDIELKEFLSGNRHSDPTIRITSNQLTVFQSLEMRFDSSCIGAESS